MAMKLTESIDPKKCLTLLNMSKNDLKETFWDKDELCGDFNWTTYLNNIKRFLKKGAVSGGEIEQTYNYAKNQSDGRLYVANGCGLQMLQSKIVRYLAGEYYYDVDIKNCHPAIIQHICTTLDIPTFFLKEYVTKREETLKNNKLNKFDILVAINKDNNKPRKNNEWFNAFIVEMSRIKTAIIEKIPTLVTDNEKNPVSSKVNHYVLTYENKIIQQAIEYFQPNNVGVCMFDGLMVNKSFCQEDDVDTHIKELNQLVHDEYGGLIKFVQKPMSCDVNLSEAEDNIEEYEQVKERFEQDHFLTISPYAYWKKSQNSDGHWSYNQIGLTDFKNVCEEYRIIDFDERGIMQNQSIFNKWTRDKTKRQYQCVDFIPYTTKDPSPDHVYNTFTNYQINEAKGVYEWKPTDNFDRLLMSLANNDPAMKDYLWKYTCKMIQQPAVLSKTVILFKGLEGGGKDSYFQALENILGQRYYSTVDTMDSMFGNFNSVIQDKILISLNEMTGKNGLDYQERIKQQATNQKNVINCKFQKPITQTNSIHLFVNSNHDAPVNISVTDRRFVVCKTSNDLVVKTNDKAKQANNIKFWNQFYDDITCINWQKSLYSRFMNEDISKFQAHVDAPKTSELEMMKSKNINPVDQYMKELIDAKNYSQFLKVTVNKEEKHIIKWKTFSTMYNKWLVDNISSDHTPKDTQIKQKLKNMNDGFEASKVIRHTDPHTKKSKTEKFAVFDFEIMDQYLETFIFNDVDDVAIDIGTVKFPEVKKFDYGKALDSR